MPPYQSGSLIRVEEGYLTTHQLPKFNQISSSQKIIASSYTLQQIQARAEVLGTAAE
jgi:hypothetical protein